MTAPRRAGLRRSLVAMAAAVLLALVLGCSGCNPLDLLPSNKPDAASSAEGGGQQGTADRPAVPTMAPPAPPVAGLAALPSFAELVKRTKPAVVLVRARRYVVNQRGERKLAEGLGSGFIYDSKGYLLTNHHVVADAHELEVKLADDRQLEARVVGADKPTDIAVLKVAQRDLPALPLGDSKALHVGDWVVAIGNPFGLEHTVSAGILSAKERTGSDLEGLDKKGYFNFLQTDASINLGNSGGPLLNVAGQVVGINTAIRAGANNIGFAIPMEMVLQLLPRLLKDGRIRRSAIGIKVADLTLDERKRLDVDHGARVVVVFPREAAARAGLKPDDVLLSFDGKPVLGADELRWRAALAGVGRTVDTTLLRDGEKRSVKLTLGALDG